MPTEEFSRNRSKIAQNVYHRRRSSQVAEQVWRLRQKQLMEKFVDEVGRLRVISIKSDVVYFIYL